MKKESTMWRNLEVVLSAPMTLNVESVSAGNDLSLCMNNFGLKLEPDYGPTSLTQVISFRVPFALVSDQQLIGYKQTLLFGLQRTPGVRISVIAELAGTIKTLEFDFVDEIAAEKQDIAQNALSVFSVQGLELGVGLYGPVADYIATLCITIQRRTLKESGVIQIDGLDIRSITVNCD